MLQVRLRAVLKSQQAWPESLSFVEWVQVEWGGSNGMGRWGKTSVQTDGYYHKLAHVTDNYRSHFDRTVKFQKRFLYFGATYCIAPAWLHTICIYFFFGSTSLLRNCLMPLVFLKLLTSLNKRNSTEKKSDSNGLYVINKNHPFIIQFLFLFSSCFVSC